MVAFNRTYRQQVIDEYLNATGRNHFVPAEFLEWLQPQEDHRVWAVFFGKSDEDAAHQYRLTVARQFVAGLRIVVNAQTSTGQVTVKVPAFISPMADRRSGGGYLPIDVRRSDSTAELCRQAAEDLARWLRRWEGTAAIVSVDVSEAKKIAGALAACGVEAAA